MENDSFLVEFYFTNWLGYLLKHTSTLGRGTYMYICVQANVFKHYFLAFSHASFVKSNKNCKMASVFFLGNWQHFEVGHT